jgi:hypothetical protein
VCRPKIIDKHHYSNVYDLHYPVLPQILNPELRNATRQSGRGPDGLYDPSLRCRSKNSFFWTCIEAIELWLTWILIQVRKKIIT